MNHNIFNLFCINHRFFILYFLIFVTLSKIINLLKKKKKAILEGNTHSFFEIKFQFLFSTDEKKIQFYDFK